MEQSIDEIDSSENLVDNYRRFPKAQPIAKRKHPQASDLPETITILKEPNNDATVYLVGTAHFSEKSQREVAEIIEMTQPDVVMVELCQNRVNVLSLDEQTLLKDASEMNLTKFRSIIKSNGVIHGIIQVLFLNLSAQLTKQFGMAPGGEFRSAYRQAQKVPGCTFVLGDRPISITLRRTINSLSTWQKLRLGWSLITSNEKLTNEDIEKYMEKDVLEKLLSQISDEYPQLSRVLIEERDQFLSYSLRKCSQMIPIETNENGFISPTVVAVVGIGHVQGIIKQWNQPTINDIQHLIHLENPSKSKENSRWSNCLMFSLKLACVGAVAAVIFQLTRSRLR